MTISAAALIVLFLYAVAQPTRAERQNTIDRITTVGRGATHWSGQEWSR